MDRKLLEDKLKMWQGKLEDLEKELDAISKRKGEAAAMGDLSENAAYQMASEEADIYRTRIVEVQKIIKKLEVDLAKAGKGV
ncbi:MAG: hypothetical protein US86_C0001G0369 [Candidatus Daviesbacteria bacterium GW2011_GWA2_38_24]|uniref:Transcription elongation factor GreA/GreB N-terminal domain-containing protein n=1 Tax=Candidatus Daviesbacteria bacterium GW2011_GWA2_38_24 TaxID=1618422 RepID=A0A0G0JKP5_9BACT|nr:MAG: hypothetical protein US86_C0001G0369 [Candidatus Daviesbacteria bacterium GW2011_GWA2_38_24]KKQ79854.1 MAG: hypothetical protein UT01_C0026G0003 [Candidatus Daviesbacteria bacterium GW2011_GWA1_38_7]OGE22922.1 MAG: hypothetical protein A2688_03405 [Candidatus Daviesbacteria bacterium RIFCSPHIGHO2_01_FULL_38_8]